MINGGAIDAGFYEKIIHMLGLVDKLKSYPSGLSGGEQQRTAIAHAMIMKPAGSEPAGRLPIQRGIKLSGRRGEVQPEAPRDHLPKKIWAVDSGAPKGLLWKQSREARCQAGRISGGGRCRRKAGQAGCIIRPGARIQ